MIDTGSTGTWDIRNHIAVHMNFTETNVTGGVEDLQSVGSIIMAVLGVITD